MIIKTMTREDMQIGENFRIKWYDGMETMARVMEIDGDEITCIFPEMCAGPYIVKRSDLY